MCPLFRRNRDEGMKPSMVAHMDVMSVCRRALEWDQAAKTYRWATPDQVSSSIISTMTY